MCLRFFDTGGATVKTPLDERVMSIAPADLMQVPRRVGVAGGASKYRAIRAALRGAWANVLVTDLVLRGERGVMLSRSCSALGIPTVTLTGRDFLPDQVSRPPPLLEKPFRFSDLQRVLTAIDTARSAPAVHRPRISAA